MFRSEDGHILTETCKGIHINIWVTLDGVVKWIYKVRSILEYLVDSVKYFAIKLERGKDS
jgi:hypothetical protein